MKYFEHQFLFEEVSLLFSQVSGKDYALRANLLLNKLLSNLYYLDIKREEWSYPYSQQKNDAIQSALLEKNCISKDIAQYCSLTKLYYVLTSWGEDLKEDFLTPCKSIFVDILRWYFRAGKDAFLLRQILEEQNISAWYQKITAESFEELYATLQKMDQALEEEIDEQHAWGVAMYAVSQNKEKGRK